MGTVTSGVIPSKPSFTPSQCHLLALFCLFSCCIVRGLLTAAKRVSSDTDSLVVLLRWRRFCEVLWAGSRAASGFVVSPMRHGLSANIDTHTSTLRATERPPHTAILPST